jgi:hypothetical protein
MNSFDRSYFAIGAKPVACLPRNLPLTPIVRMSWCRAQEFDDGRGRFPEDLRVKAPRGARAAIAAAAQLKHTTHSEYVRQALLRCLEADGVKIRRGTVEVT